MRSAGLGAGSEVGEGTEDSRRLLGCELSRKAQGRNYGYFGLASLLESLFLYFFPNNLIPGACHLEGQKTGSIPPSRVLSFIVVRMQVDRWVGGQNVQPSLGRHSFLTPCFFPLFLTSAGKFLLRMPRGMAPKESLPVAFTQRLLQVRGLCCTCQLIHSPALVGFLLSPE